MKPSFSTILQWTVLLLVVVLVASEVTVYVPPLKGGQSLSVTFEATPGMITIRSSLLSSYSGTFRQAIDWVNSTSTVRSIYYFYDPSYPTSYSNLVSWYGVPFYLNIVASSRGLPISVVVVDANELANILTDPTTAVGGLLVFASGALPSTVYTTSTNLVGPWLQEGGRLVWIGDTIGYLSARPGQGISDGNNNPGLNGTKSFLGFTDFGPGGAYTNSTPISLAVNFDWSTDSLPSGGLNVSEVLARNGVAEGNIMDGFTNAALLRVGAGAILDIAAPLIQGTEQQFANSVMNMVQLGLLYPTTVFVSESTRIVAAGGSATWIDTVATGGPSPTTSWSLCAFTEQVDVSALFGSSSCQSGLPPP